MIERMLPGNGHRQNREDAYQSVCEALLKNDLQRLRAYSGRGSPSGFIAAHHREPGRRFRAHDHSAPPAAGRDRSACPALDQSIFRLLYWERLDADPAILLAHLSRPATHGRA